MTTDKYLAMIQPLAKAATEMTITERKILAAALSKIQYTKTGNERTVRISKEELREIIGTERDLGRLAYDIKHKDRYKLVNLRCSSEGMMKKAIYREDNKDMVFSFKNILSSAGLEHGKDGALVITFNYDIMPYLEGLTHDYATFLLSDILSLPNTQTGAYAYNIYTYLRLHCDTRKINTKSFTIDQLREIMGIPDDKYRRSTGTYDISGFEKKALIPALLLLTKSKHVRVATKSNSVYAKESDRYRKWTGGKKAVYIITYSIDTRH